jgi:thiol-disulfide isomerase/thioredoxin
VSGLVWEVLVLLVTAAVIAEAFVLMGVMRQLGTLLLHVRPGAPHEVGGGPDVGTVLDVPDIPFADGAVVLFIAPGCEPCANLLPSVPIVQGNHPDVELVAVVAYGDPEQRKLYAEKVGPYARADLDHLYRDWQIPGTPFALSLDRERRLRLKGIVNTLEQLTVMAEAAGQQPQAPDDGVATHSNGQRKNFSSAEVAALHTPR